MGKGRSWDDQYEDIVSGGNKRFRKDGSGGYSDRYWDAVDSAAAASGGRSSRDRLRKSGGLLAYFDDNSGPTFRETTLQRDLSNPYYHQVAQRLGLRKLDNASDIQQVYDYIDGGRKEAPAPKAEEAVSLAENWRAANPKPEAQDEGEAPPPQSGGFQPGGSYAQALARNDGSLYDNISMRGREKQDEFKSIGRRYLEDARRETWEIGDSTRAAVDKLQGKPTDYINPWTTAVGPKGETLRNLFRDLANG